MANKIQFLIRGGTLPNGTYGLLIEVGSIQTKEIVHSIGQSVAHMLMERYEVEELNPADFAPDRKVN